MRGTVDTLAFFQPVLSRQVERKENQRLEREGKKAQRAAERVALKEALKAEKARCPPSALSHAPNESHNLYNNREL